MCLRHCALGAIDHVGDQAARIGQGGVAWYHSPLEEALDGGTLGSQIIYLFYQVELKLWQKFDLAGRFHSLLRAPSVDSLPILNVVEER